MRWAPCVAAAVLSSIAIPLGAQRPADVRCDPGDTEVRSLSFEGNRAHSDYVLERGIATTPSTWWRRTFKVLGKRYCLDSIATTVTDSARLAFHYQSTGFPDAQIQPIVRRLGPRSVAVTYRIVEGQPILIDSLGFVWQDTVPDQARYTQNLTVATGNRFDLFDVEVARDSIRRRLRERGYPDAQVLRNFTTDVSAHRAELVYDIYPGPRQWIGTISIPEPIPATPGAPPRVDTARVRAVLGIREGQLYDEAALEGVKRGLFDTEAFRFVDVSIDTSDTDTTDSLVNVNVTLAESQLLATRASIGYGNLDCIRAQLNHTNYNALGGLRRLDLTARASKLAYAKPTQLGSGGWCRNVLGDDPFSDTLNYYLSATVSQASLFGARIVPSLTVYSERRSEYKAFLRETPFGLIATAQQGLRTGLPMTWSYQIEYGRTVAQPAFFCAVFNVCEEDARQRLEEGRRSGVVGWSATRSRVGNIFNPTAGSAVRVDVRHASPVVGSNKDASFNRATIDATWYRPALSGSIVFRVRAGAVLGTRLDLTGAPRFIPLQERLYAGGPSSVRGFRQNELGPAVYLPDGVVETAIPGSDTLVLLEADTLRGERTVPTGGDNVVVANLELRVRSPAFPELVQLAFFVDAGQVWNRGRAGTGVNFRDIRITPGIGTRVFTPVGPIRVDIGYNAYQRQPGPAYFTQSLGTGSGSLFCVSPGNALRVIKRAPSLYEPLDTGDCPATYAPDRGGSFLNRLTLQFSIGQPF